MNNVDEVQQAIEDMGYSTYSFESQRKPLEEQTRQIQLLFGGLGMISMLVAAIGIANTMVMSIYERTREIGLKKAIGARKSRILFQFLTEAAVLTSLGGLLGVGAGIVMAKVISGMSGAPMAIDVGATVIAVAFSVLIGVVFGLLPAIKASNLNPIEALRRE